MCPPPVSRLVLTCLIVSDSSSFQRHAQVQGADAPTYGAVFRDMPKSRVQMPQLMVQFSETCPGPGCRCPNVMVPFIDLPRSCGFNFNKVILKKTRQELNKTKDNTPFTSFLHFACYDRNFSFYILYDFLSDSYTRVKLKWDAR